GDVSADSHAVGVRHLGDLGDKFGLYGAIDLDLDVAQLGVAVDVVFGFLFGVGKDLGGALEGAAAVDKSGFQHAGTDLGAVVEALLHGAEHVDVIGHVADAGDAGSHVQQAVIGPEVDVHVPEAGHQSFAGGVDDFCA